MNQNGSKPKMCFIVLFPIEISVKNASFTPGWIITLQMSEDHGSAALYIVLQPQEERVFLFKCHCCFLHFVSLLSG